MKQIINTQLYVDSISKVVLENDSQLTYFVYSNLLLTTSSVGL